MNGFTLSLRFFLIKHKRALRLWGIAVLASVLLITAAAVAVPIIQNRAAESRSPWTEKPFSGVREPLRLTPHTPYGELSVRHIRTMSETLYSRPPFTYRELDAALWIVEELLAMGYAWDDIEVQEFTWEDVSRMTWMRWEQMDSWIVGDVPRRRVSQNVILTVPGPSDQIIVAGAHYDSLPVPGASDNASGTALLLESAQRMLGQDNHHTLVYVFFGAEEIGLLGAYHYVRSLTQEQREAILFMVNADVLFEGPYLLYMAGYLDIQETPYRDMRLGDDDFTRRWRGMAGALNDEHDFELTPYWELFPNSDHFAFMQEGYTVLFLFGMDFDEHGNLHMRVVHTDRDCYHYIQETWPGKIDANMRAFSLFLEEVLLARY